MDPLERVPDLQGVIQQAIQGHMQEIYTTAPVQIVSFDPVKWTCSARILTMVRHEFPVNNTVGLPTPWLNPESRAIVQPKDDTVQYVWEEPSMLVDCPVVFLAGAGFTVFAPPRPGDEALAFFSFRSIDEWWSFGPPATRRSDLRSHSAADAFILSGVRSKPRAAQLPPIDPTSFSIMHEDGEVGMVMDSSSIALTAPSISTSGNLDVSSGASGTFTDSTGQIVTVTNGIITNLG